MVTKLNNLNTKISLNYNLLLFLVTSIRNYKFNPTNDLVKNIKMLVVELIQPIRTLLCRPLYITSGLRPIDLNTKLGGSKNSDHIYGYAADLTDRKYNQHKLFRLIILIINNKRLKFTQLIYLRDCLCIHISYNPSKLKNLILIRDRINGKYVYTLTK